MTVSKIHTNPEHLRRSGTKLGGFGGKLADGGQRLESAGQRLVSHAGGDRSGIGSVISKAFGKGVQITGKVFQEGGRVVEGAGKRLHTTADLHEGADQHGAGLLKKLHPDTKGKVGPKEAVALLRSRRPTERRIPDIRRSFVTRTVLPVTATGPTAPSRPGISLTPTPSWSTKETWRRPHSRRPAWRKAARQAIHRSSPACRPTPTR
jgi:hypothetical protein